MKTAFVVGAKASQGLALRAALAGVCGVEWQEKKACRPVPPGRSVYVVWTRFCCHSLHDQTRRAARRTPGAKVLLHGGGLKTMAARIRAETEGRV